MQKVTVSLWYKRDSGHADYQSLISKDDCRSAGHPFLQISTKDNQVGGRLRPIYNKLAPLLSIAVSYDKTDLR